MLKDLEKILDEHDSSGGNSEDLEREMRKAAQLLWRCQFLYEGDWNTKAAYDLIRRHSAYFEKLFDALGYEIVRRSIDRMIGLLAIEVPARQTMKLEESLLLLVLRLYYAEALKRFEANEAGEVEVDSETLLSVYEERTHRDRPGIGRVHEVLGQFKQRGLVRYGDHESNRNFTVHLRPALPIVVGEEALASLDEFVKKSSGIATEDHADTSREIRHDRAAPHPPR